MRDPRDYPSDPARAPRWHAAPRGNPRLPAPAISLEPARGLRNKVVHVPCKVWQVAPSPGFGKKELAHAHLEICALCPFGCRYCSSNWGNFLRVNREYFADLTEEQLGVRIYPDEDPSLTLVWDDIVPSLERELSKHRQGWGSDRTLVFSMLTDAFAPRLLADGTTREALRLLIRLTLFRIRVLTKNAVVGTAEWIEFFKQHADRYVIGLSTGTLDDRWAARVELGTSPPSSRIAALRALQDAGLRTFGMLCPMLPDLLADSGVELLVDAIRPNLCETVWAEPYNDRGNWEKVRAGYAPGSAGHEFLTDVYERGSRARWSAYATDLYVRLRAHAERHGWLPKLRYLLYEKLITAEDAERLGDMAGILLQSKPGEDGLSQNPHIAARQRRLGHRGRRTAKRGRK